MLTNDFSVLVCCSNTPSADCFPSSPALPHCGCTVLAASLHWSSFGLQLNQAVDLLMKWTDLRPADLILQYRENVIDKALLTPAPPKPPPLLPPSSHQHHPNPPSTHQLPLNPPPGDNRFSRATDQRASLPKQLVLIWPPHHVLKSIQCWPIRNKSPTQ